MTTRVATSSPKRSASPRKTGRRYHGASVAPLSAKQIWSLRMLAKQAFEYLGLTGEIDAWRKDQQRLVTGNASLSNCDQTHYLPLKAHFAELAGESGVQLEAEIRLPEEAKRQARHVLEVALDERRLDLGYAEKICRDQYGCALDDAATKQIWSILYVVKDRRKPVVDDSGAQPF